MGLRLLVTGLLLLSMLVSSCVTVEDSKELMDQNNDGELNETSTVEEQEDIYEDSDSQSVDTVDLIETEGYLVAKDYYEETFQSIEEIIEDLNQIISRSNYTQWLHMLTDEYISHFSSADVLQEISSQPLMQRYNIRLRSLRDYFNYVVVPSRQNARLDDLIFLSDTQVKALMIVDQTPSILYYLQNIDGNWKIAVLE